MKMRSLGLERILQLRFDKRDKFRPGKTIHGLVDEKVDENDKEGRQVVCQQLRSH